MKKLILLLALTNFLSANFFNESDKQIHMGVSALVGATGTLVAKEYGFGKYESIGIGILSALAVGALKEAYDSRDGGTGWDNRDMMANGIGGALGGGLVLITF